MKTILKTIAIIITFISYTCKAQTVNDYTTFYNEVVPKLNVVAINKTQFYGQNFSNFYDELLSKNINVISLSYDHKTDPSSKYYTLRLFFEDSDLWSVATDNQFQYPWVSITFENEIPSQIKSMVLQNEGQWDNTFVQFFANMKIEKIKFVGVNGYNNSDRTTK